MRDLQLPLRAGGGGRLPRGALPLRPAGSPGDRVWGLREGGAEQGAGPGVLQEQQPLVRAGRQAGAGRSGGGRSWASETGTPEAGQTPGAGGRGRSQGLGMQGQAGPGPKADRGAGRAFVNSQSRGGPQESARESGEPQPEGGITSACPGPRGPTRTAPTAALPREGPCRLGDPSPLHPGVPLPCCVLGNPPSLGSAHTSHRQGGRRTSNSLQETK